MSKFRKIWRFHHAVENVIYLTKYVTPENFCRCPQNAHDTQGTYKRSTKARSRHNFWCGKAISITYSVYVCSLCYTSRKAHAPYYTVICGLSNCFIFFHVVPPSTIFGNMLLNITCVFWFPLQLSTETFLILRRNQWDINVHMYSCKVPVILVSFYWNFNLIDRISKNLQISDFMNIPSYGSRVLPCERTDRQTLRS